jgi:hypothetical protein
MRWLWKRQARPIEPRRAANIRVLELETAKEILAEVFRAQPADVEEMIQNRLEEMNWPEVKEILLEKQSRDEETLWPATFCLGE